jgi:hypothetical protein
MTKGILTTLLMGITLAFGQGIIDEDFDGVPDSQDQCPHTPFLNQVDARGCTTTILTLPDDTIYDSMTITLGYGNSINEDLVGRERQDSAAIQISYYHNNWSYSLRSGYYSHHQSSGMLDTTIKIRKRFKLTKKLKLGVGAGLRLPTYQFTGNRTDLLLYSSLNYYPTRSLSLFGGLSHTFVRDRKITIPLRNTTSFYMGGGYFFSSHFYGGLSFGLAQSKFTNEHVIRSLSGTLYYKLNKKWFSTLSYYQEIDEDLHNAWSFKLGYKFW